MTSGVEKKNYLHSENDILLMYLYRKTLLDSKSGVILGLKKTK